LNPALVFQFNIVASHTFTFRSHEQLRA